MNRLEELLVEQTDRDLTYEETAEVQQLLRQSPEWREDDVELAAAATLVAFSSTKNEAITALPTSLREKVAQQAQAHFLLEEDAPRTAPPRDDTVKRPFPGSEDTVKRPLPTRPPIQDSPREDSKREDSPHDTAERPAPKEEPQAAVVVRIVPRSKVLIAVLATAAAIGLAILGYWYFATQVRTSEQPGGVKIAWTATGDPLGAAAQGEVVWSDAAQSGFMRFTGLAKNDATKLQYQLWIFDADRDERYPVDGGVFDIDAATGEVIVAIRPKLHVTKATMFAVTVERPGGVVVSSRERIVVLAKVI